MNNFIPPVVLLVLAVGAFMLYINPTYIEVNNIAEEISRYDEALDRSKELLTVREELVGRYNSITPEDRERLFKLLPQHIDNVRLLFDLDTLASQYGMRLVNISVNDSSSATQKGEELGPSTNSFRSVDIGFSVTSSYTDFKRLLRALETSLRVVDIKSLSFAAADSGRSQFQIILTTYWLK